MYHIWEKQEMRTRFISETLRGLSPLMWRSCQGDAKCITLWGGESHVNTCMLDCFHYCGACSIQEPSECERDACRSVGWRLQASWRLCARRPDDAVQSRQTAASFVPLLVRHLHTGGICVGLSASQFSSFLLPRSQPQNPS